MGNFELAGDLERLSFSCNLTLLKLLLLPSFILFRSTSGSPRFFGLLILTISGSGNITIIIMMIIIIIVDVIAVGADCRFALRVFPFASFPERGSCIFSAHGLSRRRFHSSIISFILNICM